MKIQVFVKERGRGDRERENKLKVIKASCCIHIDVVALFRGIVFCFHNNACFPAES